MCAKSLQVVFLKFPITEFHTMGQFFKDFSQVSNEEVMATLRKHESTLSLADHAARAGY